MKRALSIVIGLMACQVFAVAHTHPPGDSAPLKTHSPFDVDGRQPWTNKALPDEDNFAFAIIADLTGGEREGIIDVAIADLNLMVPSFVVSVGDLIEGYAGAETVEKEWDAFDEKIADLTMPFFYAVGNHDLSNPDMKKVWRQRFGPTYYHFRYRDVLFLVLNSEDWSEEEYEQISRNIERPEDLTSRDYWDGAIAGKISGFISQDQVEYFTSVIEENDDVDWTFLFMHTPMWQGDGSPQLSKIERALGNRPYTVFAGHTHAYKKFENKENSDQMHIRLGTTGGVFLPDDWAVGGKFDHIVWVTMTQSGPNIVNLKLDGILNDEGGIPAGGDKLCFSKAQCEADE